MRLISNWKTVAARAWSMWAALAASFLGIASILANHISPGSDAELVFQIATVVAAATTAVVRLLDQKDVPDA